MENELKISFNNQEKDLLLKDLCARLPYGVKVITSVGGEIRNDKEQLNFAQLSLFEAGYEDVKPYLFPISSMTAEQRKEYTHIANMYGNIGATQLTGTTIQDWLNKNHFDYRDRGLIPKGLANDATGLNIY